MEKSQELLSYKFLVGTYTDTEEQGIDLLTFFPEKDSLSLETIAKGISNPSFILTGKNQEFLYTVSENAGENGGQILSFELEDSRTALQILDSAFTAGDHPCHIAISPDEKYILVSNYSGGNLAVFKVTNGNLERVQVLQHQGSSVNKSRQESAHVHSATFDPSGDYVWVADLGSDELYRYKFESGLENPLSFEEKIPMTPGDGPRHLAFSKDRKELFVVQELTAILEVFSYQNGQMKSKQRLPLFSEEFKGALGAAEVRVSPDGQHIYASNRGDSNSISAFRKNESGIYELIQHYSSGGKMPRNFNLTSDGKYLLAAHQESHEIVVFERNAETGELANTGISIQGHKPVYLHPIQ